MEKKSGLKKFGLMIVLLCVFVIGVYFLYVGYSQVPIPATITRIGETVAKKHHRSHRFSSGSYTAYHTTLSVLYEENGEERRDDIAYVYRNRWNAPRTGEKVLITTNIMGRKVQHPDSNLRMIGWVMLAVSGIFLLIIWAMQRPEKLKNPYQTNPDDGTETQGMPLLKTTKAVRLPDGSYQWRCPVDDEFDRATYRTLLAVSGGISAFLMLLPLVSGMDGEMILIMLGCCAFMMLLAFGIGRKMLRGPNRTLMLYKLYENGIRIGSGKSVRYISFGNVKQVKAEGNRLSIRTKHSEAAIFIPPEDFETIKGYILQRIEAEKTPG